MLGYTSSYCLFYIVFVFCCPWQFSQEAVFKNRKNTTKKMKNKLITLAVLAAFALPGASVSAKTVPSGFALHAPVDGGSRISESDFGLYTKWYYTKSNNTTQVFRLYENDRTENAAGRTRVEAHTGFSKWTSSGSSDWYTYECTTQIGIAGGKDTQALFQMKDPVVAIQWEVILGLDDDGRLFINHRRDPDETLSSNAVGTGAFGFKVSSNGNRYRVWYNGSFQGSTTHQIRSDYTGNYAWRWGFYTQDQVDDSRRSVWNLSYRDSNGNQ